MPVSSFIGRERELEQAAAALGQAGVVALTGAGGVGGRPTGVPRPPPVAARFADGAWLAELAPVRDVAGVDDAVLLVMDNCEHLRQAAAALAGALVRACHRLEILATSREGLGGEGEPLLPVPPLGLPGPDAGPRDRLADAVRLFVDRAAAVTPVSS